MKIDFSGTNRIWMGVRGTDRGRRPIAKSVEFSMVPGREGLHLLGQSLRIFFPLFAALFGFGPHIRPKTEDFDIPKDQRTMIVIACGQLLTYHMLIASTLRSISKKSSKKWNFFSQTLTQ